MKTAPSHPPHPRWWRAWLTSRWGRRLQRWLGRPPEIPLPLWQHVKQLHPFLAGLSPTEDARLRQLCQQFLADKEFHGAHGLQVTDAMALSVAQQACLPLLHWGPKALNWYDDFVGIVLQPDAVWVQREVMDAAGVVHHYRESLLGEAMEGGPVMLSWADVNGSEAQRQAGHNLVIHEFAHKLEMHGKAHGVALDGCPPLPAGFLGLRRRQAQVHWRTTLHTAYDRFCRTVSMTERFGTPRPWLDAYGTHSPAEFFAVACEAYFVNPGRFAAEWPTLWPLFEAFFRPPQRGATV